jgi:PTS system cellobiose-specific IIC component
VLAAVLANVLHTDLIHLITTFIQQPLRLINTSLPGTIFIYSFGNFLFTLGIHQSVVNSVVLEPFLLINTNENMLAFANGQPIRISSTTSSCRRLAWWAARAARSRC